MILKYIYTGEIINECYAIKKSSIYTGTAAVHQLRNAADFEDREEEIAVKYFCRQKKWKETFDIKGSSNETAPENLKKLGCTFACGEFKRKDANVNCIFTDFSKFQRIVELSALIESESMTERLFKAWYLSDCDNSDNDCSSAKCQYYINMYKLAMNYCDKEKDESSMKWKAKNQIERYLIRHSKQITSTGIPSIFHCIF